MKRLGSADERFWSRVIKTDGCWLWQWTVNQYGYGLIQIDGRLKRAHRVAWEWTNGPIPAGMVICHRCDTPACVNPDHLFIGSHADNVADKMAKGRCPRGERAGSAKLTDEQAEDIRRARARGELCAAIAARLGISITTVSQIANNRRRVDPSRPIPDVGRRGQRLVRHSETERT